MERKPCKNVISVYVECKESGQIPMKEPQSIRKAQDGLFALISTATDHDEFKKEKRDGFTL